MIFLSNGLPSQPTLNEAMWCILETFFLFLAYMQHSYQMAISPTTPRQRRELLSLVVALMQGKPRISTVQAQQKARASSVVTACPDKF